MMKKKNIAMAMAAMTVASSVAPAFAATQEQAVGKTTVKKDIFTKSEKSKLVSEIKRLSSVRFTEDVTISDAEAGKCAYTISVDGVDVLLDQNTTKGINDAVQEIIDAIISAKEEIVINVVDKGHRKLKDGKIVSTQQERYENVVNLIEEEVAINKPGTNLFGKFDVKARVESGVLNITVKEKSSKANEVSEKVIKVRVGDAKIDITNPRNGKNQFESTDDLAKLSGFGLATDKDIVVNEYLAQVTIKDAVVETAKISELYDGYRLTAKGNEIANGLKSETVEVSATADDKTKLYTLTARYKDERGTLKELRITSKVREDLTDIETVLEEDGATIKTVAGNNRYTTAIQIAKKNNLTRENIVLVNSSAIVDGLSATPFAAENNANILLTDAKKLPASTLEYITKKVEENPGTEIFVIGGEGVINASVETELAKITSKSNIERLGGNNRHETSLAVAKEMHSSNRHFVVGATGEADAMSIAAYAAQENAPIIVNGFNGLSEEALELVKNSDIDVIGGKTAISKDVEAKLVEVDADEKVVRVEGSDRFETNANVIKEYYKNNLESIYVAKDGMAKKDQLVDALAAGPLAAGKGPIVLATDKLSASQETILEEKVNFGANVTQLGNGVKLSVIERLVKLLGL